MYLSISWQHSLQAAEPLYTGWRWAYSQRSYQMPFHTFLPREYKIPYRLRGLHSPFRPGVLRVPPWNSPLIRRYMTCRFFLIPLRYSRVSQMFPFRTQGSGFDKIFRILTSSCITLNMNPQTFVKRLCGYRTLSERYLSFLQRLSL